MCHSFGHTKDGFTIIEVIATLVLLGLMAIFLTPVLTNVVRGYVMTRSTDAVTQKAQIALQRMTIDFSYIVGINGISADKHSINFNCNIDNTTESSNILLYGTNVFYEMNKVEYLLLDDVNDLVFNCYASYTANAPSDCTNNSIVSISLTMHGPDWANGVTQTFSTRVAAGKISQK